MIALACVAGGLVVVGCAGSTGTEAAKIVTVTVPADQASPAVTDASAAEQTSATVQVVKKGFSQEPNFGTVGYGLELRNPSSSDAVDVAATINVVDAKGLILATDNASIPVIPARSTYYFGNETLADNGKASRLEVDVQVGSSEPASLALPEVSNLRVVDEGYGLVEARGQVKNRYTQALSQLAQISVVAEDSSGRILTGAYTFLDAPLPPGRSAAFSAQLTNVSASEIAKLHATVENEIE